MSNYDYPPYAEPRHRSPSVWPLLFLLVLAGALFWRFWPRRPDNGVDPNAQPRAVVARGDLAEDEKATITLYKQTAPSVVHVTRLEQVRDFSLDIREIPSGTGSGFVWDDSGHIVTNNHVVEGASACHVILGDHSEHAATVVGTRPESDLAILKIDAPKGSLHPILVGTSHDLQVGQKTFAIGNPFGLDQSLTTGVVSALDRELKSSENGRDLKGLIQTNAAINPGNSGGPLLDSAGRLIGVNTAIVSPSGASAGIGFAIPVDDVNRVVPELIRHGARPDLGIHPASDQLAQRFGIEGLLVIDVLPGGPAAKAGLRATRYDRRGRLRLGDIIVGIDDTPIRNVSDYIAALDDHRVGDTVTVTVLRDDEQQKVSITLVAAR